MVETTTLQSAHEEAVAHLARSGSPTPDLDVALLMEHATGLTVLDRLTRPQSPIAPRQLAMLRKAVARRMSHEPVHRIIGWREFYGLPLSLNAHTLVPRPDTETLVDAVLPFAHETVNRTGQCRILDLGTGSGAIALALLSAVPEAVATGTDVSGQALDMAATNARALGLSGRFTPLLSDWFANLRGRFDLIVSNPPYVASSTIATLDPDVRDYDPIRALDGGSDGLAAYRLIAAQYPAHLADQGGLAVEIGTDQASAVERMFVAAGLRLKTRSKDLNGRDRAVFFVR